MLNSATLLGALGLTMFVIATFTWFRRARQVAIPDNRFAFLGLWGLAGALGALGLLSSGANWLSVLFGVLAMAGGFGLLGLYAFRKQAAGDSISVGDRIPDFEAVTDQGLTFRSAELTGLTTLVKFFRGHW